MKIFCGAGHKQREQTERDKYISSSLAFSKDIVNRLSSSRRSNRPGDLTRISFDQEWPQEDSGVLQWYKTLQQQNLETRFSSIEHRRHTDNQLFHEFILLKLLDGGICRVERGGDGSRVDAVRLIGCTPHDLIQRFEKDEYNKPPASRASELIGEIHFNREFDIRDVLAICYSVQRTPACTVYTLQRYNCYFLCWTIISILTRQLESWETLASTEWDAAVTSELNRLSSLSTKDAKTVFPLRLLALLDPDGSHPAECLISQLRTELHSSTGALQKRNQAFAATLWADDDRLAMRQGLKSTFKSTEINLMSSQNACMAKFGAAKKAKAMELRASLAGREHFVQEVLGELNQPFYEIIVRVLKLVFEILILVKPERSLPPIYSSMLNFAPLLSTAFLRFPSYPLWRPIYQQYWNNIPTWWFDFAVGICYIYFRVMHYIRLYLLNVGNDRGGFRRKLETAMDLIYRRYFTRFLGGPLREMDEKGLFSEPNADACLKIAWLVEPGASFDMFVYDMLEPCLLAIPSPVQGHCMHLRFDKKETALRDPKAGMTVGEFQAVYLQPRILLHAERIENYQLGEAPLVYDAVRNTITEVWRSMPSTGYKPQVEMKPYSLYPGKLFSLSISLVTTKTLYMNNEEGFSQFLNEINKWDAETATSSK